MTDALKSARKKRGLTQAEIASALGRDQSTVSKWEAGEIRPDVAIAPRYAELIGLSVVEVLYPATSSVVEQSSTAPGGAHEA
jgi:transcriptional regulator with XRE-family HTH domain